jgi:hypothetical protein
MFTRSDHELKTYPALNDPTTPPESTTTIQRGMAMKRRFLGLALVAGILALSETWVGPVQAADEAQERAELAKALKGTKATLQNGLKASMSQGKPISAKFEIDDGKLQLSIYTVKGNSFSEVVVDTKGGKAEKAETITDKDDLEHAAAQKAAMDKAKITLLSAANNALKSNNGYRVVSVFPEMKTGRPVADITLLRGRAFKTVSETLD